jgi:hypothetical protein
MREKQFSSPLVSRVLVLLTLTSLVACGGGSFKKTNLTDTSSISNALSSRATSSQLSNSSKLSASSLTTNSLTTNSLTSSSATSNGLAGNFLMGGSIQRAPLNLTNEVTTFAGIPRGADGTAALARFNLAESTASDGTNLYVADTANHTIRKIDIATGKVTTLAGAAGITGTDDGVGNAARFREPKGITFHAGYLYVVEPEKLFNPLKVIGNI